MKIFLTSRIAATVLLAFTACVSVSAEAFTVAKRGEKAACVVAVPASPSACLKHAAGEFSAYVKRMTGVELPVVTGDPGGKPAVRLVSGVKLGRDSFRFRTSGSDFLIEGDDDRSVLFGVYDFLENRCGCDWLSADQEIVPARDTIEVADGFELLRKPAFRIRESSYSDMRHSPDFAAKMKLNGYMFNGRWKDIHGGAPAECIDPWLGKCHTFMRLLPPEKYFKDHPEYYAEVNGKREYAKRMQLCLTNPDVVRIVTSNVLARIAKMYPKVKIFGVSQSDRWVFCTCKNCAAVDAREESHAGTNIEFVNKIADAVAEKYPDVLIETLAYQYTCKPPKFVRPRPNVMICLCSDNCDFSMPLGKSRYRFRNMNDFVDDLKWWCAEAKHVYVWNYTMNFRYYMHAFPNVYCLKPDLETFLDCGVTEVYEQGVKSPHQALTALKTYLIGHLLWDPRQPLEPLLERFYRGYYGAAAPWIRRYVEELHAISRDRDEVRHPMKMWGVVDSPALKTEFFDRGAEYLAKAAEAVKDDPVRLRNVQWEMNANDYTRIMRSGMISALRRDGKYPLSPKMKELQSAARRIAADWKAFPKTARVSEDTKVLEVSKRRIETYAGFDPFKADVGKCVDVPAAELHVWSEGKYLKLGFSDIHVDTGSVCRVKAYVKADLPADAKPDDKVFGMFVRGQPKTDRSYRVKDLKPGPYGFGWYELRNPCDVRDGGYYIFEKYGKYPVEVKKVRVAFADVTDWFIGVDAPLPLGTNGVSDTAAFVKTVTNRAEVAKAEWTVTGLGIFRVWVNGTETGTEDFLKPGLTHVDKRRSTFTYDVTELMKKPAGGTNVFAAEVSGGWWRDRVTSAPYVRRKTESGFYGVLKVTYADGSVTEVPTDETWRAAYYSPVTHAEIYWGEDYDSRVKADWRRTGDVDWPAAKLNLEFSGELTPMEGRSIKVRRDLTLAPKSVYVWKGAEGAAEDRFGKAKILRHGELSGKVDLMPGETLVVDFGQNASGVPEFTAVAESGTMLCARPAEMLNDSEGEKVRGNDGPAGSAYFANYRKTRTSVQYVFSGAGAETYMPTFSFFGGRYFSFTATAKVSFSSIRFLPVMSIAREDETGVLVTGHEGINKLVSNCVWGMRSNFLSVPTDCPQRNERLGWTGDTQAFSGAAVYAADVYGFFMKWMTDMRDNQMQEGERSVGPRTPNRPGSYRSVAPPGPAGEGGHRIGWSDAGVIVPYAVWRQSGDTRIVDANWDSMCAYMALLKSTKYISAEKEFQTADWLSMEKYEAWRRGWGSKYAENPFWPGETEEDMRRYWDFLGACYRIMDLRMMCEMGKAIGRDGAVEAFAAEEKEAVAEFRDKHLESDGLAPKFLRGMQTPALFLIRLGLLKTPEAVKKTADELKTSIRADGFKPRTGFLGTTILLDTITDELGDPGFAYSVLLQRGCPGWLYSVDQGATTIWERWNGYTKEKGFGPVAMNSFNHYAYGAVMGWMYRSMAGIRPGKDGGYRRFVLTPHPDRRIGFCSAEYRTRYGTVKSSWRYDEDGKCWYSFTVPEGTTATLRLPGKQEKTLRSGIHEMVVD